MPLILSVCSLKGGSGKTTLATNLAVCLASAGHRVTVVDADEGQGSSLSWGAIGRRLPVVAAGRSLMATLGTLTTDVIVIDGPPRLGIETREAMLVAHYVLVPSIPGASDSWALRKTVTVLLEAQKVQPKLHGAVVWNNVERTSLALAAQNAVQNLDVPVLEARLGHRVAFGEALLRGQGVVESQPDSEAAWEVRRLVKEVLKEVRRVQGQA
jgi:chromosome partitioning protein